MAKVELVMPKMGESIIEATILKWNKKVGDAINVDDTILEIATDKVDSEIPSPVTGIIREILYPEDTVVAVGKVIAILETEGQEAAVVSSPAVADIPAAAAPETASVNTIMQDMQVADTMRRSTEHSGADDRFYSPLVKNIAKEENIAADELGRIPGTGSGGRVTKQDMMQYLANRTQLSQTAIPAVTTRPAYEPAVPAQQVPTPGPTPGQQSATPASSGGNVEIIEMDRMRRIIADHMVMSKQTSPHVTSFVEADVTNMVVWREKNKKKFLEKYGENITFTPLFIEAVVQAIKDYPLVNISLDGTRIIVKKDINIGMAAALPTGNLIVPVIKNADLFNLAGLSKSVNDLAMRARENKLKPEEIKDGTFTITNVGTFGNIMGTPIINQPQVAILATGAIRKKPAVLETVYGDVIAIRQMMYLSLAYDHRVVDGYLGGSFLKRIAEYMERFDPDRQI